MIDIQTTLNENGNEIFFVINDTVDIKVSVHKNKSAYTVTILESKTIPVHVELSSDVEEFEI